MNEPNQIGAEHKILIPYERVSDPSQATEDKTGLERQFLSARRTLTAHPSWTIDEKFTLTDSGLSGYHGKNLDPEAALGGFLKAVKEGKIPLTPTKVLHIDDMSRLSRLNIRRARRLFEDILEAGVEIFDAEDNKLYTEASLDDLLDLVISLVRHEGAYKHSKNLADKISKAWQIKKQRSADTGKAYRFKPPGWLKWNAKIEAYDTIPEKVQSVRRVFELACSGLGVRGITKRLNEENATRIGNYGGDKIKSTRWATVVVAGLIHSQKVLGMNENVSPPVKMYPQVIDDKVYYAAKAKVDQRRTGKFYGRNSDHGRNLFLRLAKCTCGEPMQWHGITANAKYRRKKATYGTRGGIGARGGKENHEYLWCTGYLSGTCPTKQVRYDHIEESFVAAVSCSVHTLTLADSKKGTPDGKDTEMLKGQLAETRQKLGEYTKDYEETPSKSLAGLMVKAEQEETRLLAELESATTIEIGWTPISEAKKELMALMYKDWNCESTRLRARELIRTLVEKLTIDKAKQSYTIHWKGYANPTTVELAIRAQKLKGYTINGTYYPSMGRDWKQCTADIARYAKDVEANPLPLVVAV